MRPRRRTLRIVTAPGGPCCLILEQARTREPTAPCNPGANLELWNTELAHRQPGVDWRDVSDPEHLLVRESVHRSGLEMGRPGEDDTGLQFHAGHGGRKREDSSLPRWEYPDARTHFSVGSSSKV